MWFSANPRGKKFFTDNSGHPIYECDVEPLIGIAYKENYELGWMRAGLETKNMYEII